MQTASFTGSPCTPLLKARLPLPANPKPNIRLRPSAAVAAAFAAPIHGLPRPRISISSRLCAWISDRTESIVVRASAANVSDDSEATVKSGALLQTLQLGSLFGLWYLFNIYFNIYNKQKAIAASSISTIKKGPTTSVCDKGLPPVPVTTSIFVNSTSVPSSKDILLQVNEQSSAKAAIDLLVRRATKNLRISEHTDAAEYTWKKDVSVAVLTTDTQLCATLTCDIYKHSRATEVVECRVCGDPRSPLRFTFIEFSKESEGRAALNLGGAVIDYCQLRVLPSKTTIVPVNPKFLPQSEGE